MIIDLYFVLIYDQDMKILVSIILGIITTGIVYYITSLDTTGDFLFRGLPFPFQTAVWGKGYGWRFNPLFLILDILIWSALWLVLINFIIRVKRKV